MLCGVCLTPHACYTVFQADDAQNGRLLPLLGCFPGEVARSRKVVICNDATSDPRFQSWQYREMQDAAREPLVYLPPPSNL